MADRIADYIRHMLRNSSATPCSGGDMERVICLSGLKRETTFMPYQSIRSGE
ncbi:MAG: hypothetical protein M3044_13655 [Thermoproteota archaeon]|nr:hypothetical protein [Thermoproteota archaeon]